MDEEAKRQMEQGLFMFGVGRDPRLILSYLCDVIDGFSFPASI